MRNIDLDRRESRRANSRSRNGIKPARKGEIGARARLPFHRHPDEPPSPLLPGRTTLTFLPVNRDSIAAHGSGETKKKKNIPDTIFDEIGFFFCPRVTFLSLYRNREVKARITELEIAAAKRNYASRVVSFRGGKFPASGNGRRTPHALLQAAGIFETRELERNSGDLCCENIGGYC